MNSLSPGFRWGSDEVQPPCLAADPGSGPGPLTQVRAAGRSLRSSQTNHSSRFDFVNNSSTLLFKTHFFSGSEPRRNAAVLR